MRKLFIFCLLLCGKCAFAQEAWEDDYLKAQKVYTSLSEALQNPDSVFRLDLSKKKLKEFPVEIFQLMELRELKLNNNSINQIPENIYKLNYLQRLFVNNNKLVELPQRIGTLKNLVILELNRNRIEKLPPEIGLLNNLEELSLWDNELSGIPDEIKNLGSLKKLELRGILFNEDQQRRIHDLLPYTTIYFSPACNCKQ
jgi:Leucine-rich repeat (LRR) protein